MAEHTDPAESAPRGPVFIVGPMGSGTTLMRLIVDSHDNIAIAQETSIMRAYLAHKWIPFHRHGGDWYGRLGWSDDELDERMREFYAGMFERFAKQQGKGRWGDKTPWHTWMIRDITRVFPDSVILATVRHPGAVANSVSKRFRIGYGGAISHWVNTVTELQQRGRELGNRLLLVRYEDLVVDPEPTLREIFDWLDEPWSDRLLAHHEIHQERGTPQKVEGATRSDEAIDPSRIGSWRERTTPDQLKQLRERVGRLGDFYGYQVDRDEVAPIAVDGSPRRRTLNGEDLAARRALFADFADLDRTVTPWIGNRMLTPKAVDELAPRPKKQGKKQPAPPPTLLGRARRLARRVTRG